MTARSFTAYGRPLALDPKAFGMILTMPSAPENRDVNGVAVVEVRGPLMHHTDPWCDSYDAVKSRVAAAIETRPRAIVMSIDSPGGLVSGCFDTSTEIRALCDEAGVDLVAYVDGQATSAAYALACVASKVYVPSTGIVGSIGVIDAIIDATAADAALGIRYSFATSGARKADGNLHAVTTDAAVAAAQSRVDDLAALFFDHVSAARGIPTDKIASLQAGVVHGARAVALGLADGVLTFDQVIALVGSGASAASAAQPTTATTYEDTMNDEEKARAALQALAEDDTRDEAVRARARAALAAMDGEEKPADEHKEPDGDEGKAEGDGEPDGDEPEKKGEEAKALAMAAKALAIAERGERARIMASRGDLTDTQRKALASLPLEHLETALGAIPRAKANPAATANVTATIGDGQGGNHAGLSPAGGAMAKAMGLADNDRAGVRREGNVVTFFARRDAGNRGA